MKQLLKYFVQGLIYVVPISVTIYVIWEVFLFIDQLIPVNVPGLGFLLVLIFITVVGVVSRHIISDRILDIFEGYVKRTPLISILYTAIKDLMQAFVGKKRSFSKPVLVKLYEHSDIRRMGFITNNNFEELDESCDLITVYIPHSYNISGNMFLVPKRYVQPFKAHAADVMKYAMSGGVTEIELLNTQQDKEGEEEKR